MHYVSIVASCVHVSESHWFVLKDLVVVIILYYIILYYIIYDVIIGSDVRATAS